MRIVGGRWAGQDLISPGGRIRPTAEAVRGRWLSSLQADLQGAHVLDLFAGTGALGLEALSRGAAKVDFVEWSPAALHALKGNVAAFKARNDARIFRKDAFLFLDGMPAVGRGPAAARVPGSLPYDLVLADPPYTSTLAARLVECWKERPFSRILSVEHAADGELPAGGEGWTLDGTGVTTWRASSGEAHPPGEGAGPPA